MPCRGEQVRRPSRANISHVRLRGRVGAALLAVIVLVPALAHGERLPLRQYARPDGLPHERVKRIVADSRGFIWFATPDGLGRFDGNRFVTWRRGDGLPHDSINDILETRDGIYWFATNGGGVARLDPPDAPRTDGAGSRFVTATIGGTGASQRVNTLFEDRDGTIWAGSDDGLFRRAAPAKGDESAGAAADPSMRFEPVVLGLDGIDGQRLNVWCFAQDERGRLWIGTSAGLLVREIDGRFERLPINAGSGREDIWALRVDRSGRLWIGHYQAIVVVNPARADAQAIRSLLAGARPQPIGDAPALPTEDGQAVRYALSRDGAPVSVRSILEDDDGTVWVATLGLGLISFERRGPRVWNETHGLSDARLLTLALDRNGNVWLGLLSRGAMRLARGGFTFFGEADGLVGRVTRVFEDDGGSLYVSTDGGRIFRMVNERLEPFGPIAAESAASPTGDFARSPIRDHVGAWWVPTPRGLIRFPAAASPLRTARPEAIYTPANGLAAPAPYRVFEDSRGDVWFGYMPATSDVSLTRWERSTGTFHHYGPREGVPARLPADTFTEDASGTLWVAYYDGPVVRYRDGRFTRLFDSQVVDGALHQWTHVDRRGRLWVGRSGRGLIRVDNPSGATPELRSYGVAEGLGSNEVRGIVDDGFGRIYVATLRGVDRVDPETHRVRRFTNADGLIGAEFEIAYRDRLSRLWFSSPEGLARLTPQADDATRSAAVLIGGVLNAGVPHSVHELGEADVTEVVVQPGQERLAISLIGLGGEGLQYQYRFDQGEWSVPANQDTVQLAGLSSGRYVFEARAVSNTGVPGARTARVHFTVLAPVWQRWWFLLAVGLAVAALVATLHRMRVDRLLALERVRTRIATDLHDDIGASLSQIAILSEVARQQPEETSAEVSATLERIAATAREMVDSMSDIVWAINPRRDALSDLTHRMRRFGNDTCSAADVRFVFQAPSDDDPHRLSADLRREIYLIFKEALNNAVRHANASTIDASLAIERQHLVLTVRDNGRGFRPDKASVDGNGVSSMRRRATAVNGRLDLNSAPEQGTVITLSAPIGRAAA
jgi:signal transduction histidine kinase/ligand-binding sensor domain-containing protein